MSKRNTRDRHPSHGVFRCPVSWPFLPQGNATDRAGVAFPPRKGRESEVYYA